MDIPALMRAGVAAAEERHTASLEPLDTKLMETDTVISLRDGTRSTLQIVKPVEKPSQGSPLIVLIFGGGFIAGSSEQMRPYARQYATAFHAVVVNISYRLAPEHAFPTQQYDCFDSLRWIASNATQLGADPSKGFIVGGQSSGGYLAATVARMAQHERLAHPLTGQWLAIPILFSEQTVPDDYRPYFNSRQQNAQSPIFDKHAVDLAQTYVKWGQTADGLSSLTSFDAPLSELPPAFIQACGLDPLRDDALIYDEMLLRAGIKTRLNLYHGCPHGHWTVLPGLSATERAQTDIIAGIDWLLGLYPAAKNL